MTTPKESIGALGAKFQALVTTQKKLNWTTPAHKSQLDQVSAAIAQLSATAATSFAVSASAGAGAGVKTDALSLGVGVSAKTASGVRAGVSLGVGFSAKAALSASVVTHAQAATALVAKLNAQFSALNKASAGIAGTNGVMPPGRGVDTAGVDSAFRDLSSKLGEAQSQANAAAPPITKSPLTGEVRMARMGPWIADLATDDETALAGKLKFVIDEQEWVGTVVPEQSGIDGSRARCQLVGGNGGLSKTIPGKSYTGGSGVQVKTVVRDILRACGEDLSDLSDGPTLEQYLPRWHVAAGSAQDALTDLCNRLSISWRVLRNGEVWMGPELWPEVTPEHRVVDEDWSAGAVTLAPDTPDMVPGVVFQGRRIEHVTHTLGLTLRTEICTSHPAADLKQALSGNRRQVDYSAEWPCKVVTQNPDDTLQLLPDDDVMRASGLDKVPMRFGMPGFRVRLKPGARCHLAFAGHDPARPFATSFDANPDFVDSVECVAGGRSAGIARLGDSVKVFVAPGVPIPVSGTVSGAPFAGVMTIATPLQAIIETANPKFRA